MSQQVFNARVDLLSSVTTENPSIFIVEFNIYDGTGQFGAASIQNGDILYLDTYNYNATVSKYVITEILGAAGLYFTGKIQYVDNGDVVDPSMLAQGPGSANGYITTPSAIRKLAWHSAPTVHTLADYIVQYARDQELWDKLDGMSITGPQGVAGATGIAGVEGSTGLPGVNGLQGETGIAGVAGSAGIQGVTGLAGSAGSAGIQGETGLAGAAGSAGSAGIQGETGLAGAAGAAGSAGIQGETGLAGAAGAAGSAGIQGETGLAGAAGSAGSAGIQGETGLAGAAGSAGSAGIQGVTGLAGSAGSAGIQGVTGLAGSAGSAGIQGVTGLGTQGVTGLVGSAGSVGIQGVTGLAGSAGAQGTTGAGIQGQTGSFGAQGVTGVGLQGVTGSSGGGEGIRTLTFASGLISLRAAGLISSLSGVNAVKDFSTVGTSRCTLTVPSGVEILEVHCTFTAAETAGRTQVNVELPEPSGATTMPTSFRPFVGKWTATYGYANSVSTVTNSAGTLVIAATGFSAGAEQKVGVWV